MSINNQIEALSIRNTATKAVNMTEFNNPFLLLSSTKALNELVVNTDPSSRAKVANIEPTKSKYQQNPLGVPIDVYTKDTATTPQVPKLKGADLMAARNARAAKRRAFITANKQKRDALPAKAKVDAISKLSKQTASSAISSALSNVGKKAKAKATPAKATPAKATPVKAPHTGEGKAGGGKVGKKRGPKNQGKTAAREAEATKKRVAKAKAALQQAGAGAIGGF